MRELIGWMRANGGAQKAPQAVLILAEVTAESLGSSRDVPSMEVDAILERYLDAHGGSRPTTEPGNWLRRTSVTQWWQTHRGHIARACSAAGLAVAPDLLSPQGGGRGVSSRYQFEFRDLDAFDLKDDSEPEGEGQTPESEQVAVVRYQVDPAKPVWWARGWWIRPEGFPTRSWRGVLVLLVVLLGGVALVSLLAGTALLLWSTRTYSITDLLLLTSAAFLTWTIWVETRPLVRLPRERIVLAPSFLVSLNELNAQLTLRKGAGGAVPGGWLHLSRHWGICPLCLGEVDVAPGTPTFPGRLVGRCADSPLEHVFVFDPVTLGGVHLLPNLVGHRRGTGQD